jgi:aspartate ammonia-lyase
VSQPKQSSHRSELDSLGQVIVPADALYGAHTVRALANFPACPPLLKDLPDFVIALSQTKSAAAAANGQVDELPKPIMEAITQAATEIQAGQWLDHFPLPVLQGGGGTSTNMNINEVLANRAGELLGDARGSYRSVHPIDHVNRSQSSNDVYPTALSIAALRNGDRAVSAFAALADTCEAQAVTVPPELTRLGRTCLRDALPVSVRETHVAHARGLRRGTEDLRRALDGLRALPLGGTAVGTGFGAPAHYDRLAIEALTRLTGIDLDVSDDAMGALQSLDHYVAVAQALTRLMGTAAKIARDFRFLSSGPHAGIGELILPAVQVGSSAMPGKVNPVIPELVIQMSFRASGAQTAIEQAAAAGELELNVMDPTIAAHLLPALDACGSTAKIFAERCIRGLAWDQDTLKKHLQASLADAVELARTEGYDAASNRSSTTAAPTTPPRERYGRVRNPGEKAREGG